MSDEVVRYPSQKLVLKNIHEPEGVGQEIKKEAERVTTYEARSSNPRNVVSAPFPRTLSEFLSGTTNTISDEERESVYGNSTVLGDPIPDNISVGRFSLDMGFIQYRADGSEMDVMRTNSMLNPNEGANKSLAMGEAEVLNPPFQFNRWDDVRSDADFIRPRLGNGHGLEAGIGRYYKSHIQANYPKVLFQVGDLRFTGDAMKLIRDNFGGGLNAMAASEYIRDGGQGFKHNVGKLFAVIGNVGRRAMSAIGITPRYVKWVDRHHLHKTYTNELLIEFATYMGLIGSLSLSKDDENLRTVLSGKGDEKDYREAIEKLSDPLSGRDYFSDDGDGGFGAKAGFGAYVNPNVPLNLISIINKDPTTATTGMWKYIPYMIQNDVTVSETFSNSTRTHPFVDKMNSMAQDQEQQRQSGGLDTITSAGLNLKDIATKFGDFIMKGFSGKVGGEMGLVLSGNGRFHVPEVWQDSSFSRSYSLSFDFYSPYGDALSIFENTIVPLCPLIAMTLPRKVSPQAYMSPFIVRVTSPGLFNINMGIIESLSISRGDSKNDRPDGLYMSRKIKVNLTVRDLLPNITMTFDDGLFSSMNADNEAYHEYVMTLAGLGLSERIHDGLRIGMAASQLAGRTRNVTFEGNNIRSSLGRLIPSGLLKGIAMATGRLGDQDRNVNVYRR